MPIRITPNDLNGQKPFISLTRKLQVLKNLSDQENHMDRCNILNMVREDRMVWAEAHAVKGSRTNRVILMRSDTKQQIGQKW